MHPIILVPLGDWVINPSILNRACVSVSARIIAPGIFISLLLIINVWSAPDGCILAVDTATARGQQLAPVLGKPAKICISGIAPLTPKDDHQEFIPPGDGNIATPSSSAYAAAKAELAVG
jgi:hypothetical protein